MKTFTHNITPGPWSAGFVVGRLVSIKGADKKSVANLGNARCRPLEESEANCIAIAAVPEMITTLIKVYYMVNSISVVSLERNTKLDTIRLIRTALTKAGVAIGDY